MESILKVLLPKARDASPGVVSRVLTAIGQLAHVGNKAMLPHVDALMSVIMEALQDQSSYNKREAALQTLAQIATNTGSVFEPYIVYPYLLDILINILKTEQAHAIRRETVKVMGVLGALDPYRHKMVSVGTQFQVSKDENPENMSGLLLSGPSSEEYFPAVAVNALMKILKDPSLSVHHTAVVTAIMYIFKTLGLKCVPFLPQIMPNLFHMIKTCPTAMLEFYLQQLGVLVNIVKQHIRNYISDLIELIQNNWIASINIQTTALALIESIAIALEGEFRAYLPTLLPQMLPIFDHDNSDKQHPSHRLLSTLLTFGPNLEEYLHLVFPAIIKVYEKPTSSLSLRKQAIMLIGQLSKHMNICGQSSRIIHAISRTLTGEVSELKAVSMEILCLIVYQMNQDYIIFVPMIRKVLTSNQIVNETYEKIIAKLLIGEPLIKPVYPIKDNESVVDGQIEASAKKLAINQQQLKKAWEASQRSTRDDWQEWIRRFSVELLKESPSHALRACATLASAYYPLALELFNAGFVSCWGELYDQFQDELVRSLVIALTSPNIPPKIQTTLLNLAEFMEHDDRALPIDIRTLGVYASKCHAYAKALHYKELEFIAEPHANTIEALISINTQLQQPDSAVGILTHVQQDHDVSLKETWYEKLQRWDDGLAAYDRKLVQDPSSVDATLGRMRCLHNLGEWETLAQLAHERWESSPIDVKKQIAPLAAAASWCLGHWDPMDEYISMMKQESPDSAFFRAILALHRNLFPQAILFIEKTRDLLDTELTALVGESYNRAYKYDAANFSIVVRIQMLAELEEIINYKQLYEQPEAQLFIRKTWTSRIKGCQRNIDVWQRILKIRALVVSPQDDLEIWIKFANLCRKGGRLTLSSKTLAGLLHEPTPDFQNLNFDVNPSHVVYACFKHMWATGARQEAFLEMKDLTKSLGAKLGFMSLSEISGQVTRDSAVETQSLTKLLARCHLKLGEWQVAIKEDLSAVKK